MWYILSRFTLVALLCQSLGEAAVQNRRPHIAKTVTLGNGQVIDWIYKDSQGDVASPPPFGPGGHEIVPSVFNETTVGPKGTVPILRSNGEPSRVKVAPPLSTPMKSRIGSRQYSGQHWYVSTSQTTDNRGGSAALSMFKAFVAQNDDFSLLQTAVIRSVPSIGIQTVEAGWINFPDQKQKPHLFTFFNTNNYQTIGDYLAGWNTDVKGWVQSDTQYFPGIELTPLSVVGGAQKEIHVRYSLHNGSWWLGVNGRWAGYYPAKMFTKNGNSAQKTLQSKSDRINWYGEIYQAEDAQTTTDMGSGHFAADGYGKAAYLHNITYTDMSGRDHDFDGSQGTHVDDPKRYSIDAHFLDTGAWGSHFFLGGPGAGGKIGG
ncbi:protein of unknown function DUF239 [Purpureocillium lavendulum]|uniref:Neprosin PEP catalytic domain-containing protein n=1 Tax=Purpureocillium lavendulum TaxID=1247861 RepID=A0AB34FMS2_9HYPO|nr:protein of unknown function DUF239 [Purpureocillium lavendulum]